MDTLEILTWLIPAGPLLAFALILLVTKENKRLSFGIAWTGIITAVVLSWIVSFSVVGTYLGEEGEKKLKAEPVQVASSIAWLPIGDYYGDALGSAYAPAADKKAEESQSKASSAEDEGDAYGDEKAVYVAQPESGTWFRLGVSVDPLTAVMLFMVPFAVFMIFVYSVGYHNFGKPAGQFLGIPNHGQEEPLFSRFFALMSLFAGAMLTLVVADNLLLIFVGWEIMGFCSYSLIGFWYARSYDDPKRVPPREASIKAFMTTRIADVVMLMGLVFFYRTFGTLNYTEAFTANSLVDAIESLQPFGAAGLGIMALMIFTGTVGKSAQFPLHVWLPDAMEGPTPVSAVIHAAAMVSAGIYLVLRIFPLIGIAIAASPVFAWTIAGIGAFTALMAATIAVAQNDVKGVLAYSTISQLGFMIAALGIGGYIAAAFHLITHAYFKALLFMGSGSVIHGMEHGAEHVHDHHSDPQDMRLMGGLREKMPTTFWTFVVGGMALSGFPVITAGFWSKDEILAEAWYVFTYDFLGQHGASSSGDPFGLVGLMVFVVLCLAAFLTAFYTTRQICLTFLGKPRSELAEHAHESDGYMTTPLVVLSFFAIAAGWVGIPDTFLGTEGVFYNYFHHFVGATLYETVNNGLYKLDLIPHKIASLPFMVTPLVASIVVALGGITLGWMVYGRKPLEKGQEDPVIGFLTPPVYNFLQNKWYWDELYKAVFVRPTIYFSEVVVYEVMDKGIINGFLHLVANTIYSLGNVMRNTERAVFGDGVDWLSERFLDLTKEFRTFQSGKIQEYALLSVMIATVFAAFIIIVLPLLRDTGVVGF